MIEKNSLNEALGFVHCTELPAPAKPSDIYVLAIAKILKQNNMESYCIVENDGANNPIIKKTFGSMALVEKILEIYPLSVLRKKYLPDFKTKEDMQSFLRNCGTEESTIEKLFSSTSDDAKKAVRKLILRCCIEQQRIAEKGIEAEAEIQSQIEEKEKQEFEEIRKQNPVERVKQTEKKQTRKYGRKN